MNETRDEGDAESGAETQAYDKGELHLYAIIEEIDEAEESGILPMSATTRAAPWWTRPYQKGKPVGPSKIPRALYFPGNPAGKPPSKAGDDVLAFKRGVSRGGRWPWSPSFNAIYTEEFARGRKGGAVPATGVAGFQRQMKIEPASGQLGEGTYQALRVARIPEELPHGGEPLLDTVAVRLLQQASAPTPDATARVQASIADYCRRSVAAKAKINYRQFRPMNHLGVKPESGFTCDCSSHSTGAFFWARQETGVAVPDPNSRGFDGYGYTGTQVGNPRASSPYRVGDLALYGSSLSNTGHVCTCMKAGDATSSRWCSHGWQGDPTEVTLRYRRDLLVVVRPRLVP